MIRWLAVLVLFLLLVFVVHVGVSELLCPEFLP